MLKGTVYAMSALKLISASSYHSIYWCYVFVYVGSRGYQDYNPFKKHRLEWLQIHRIAVALDHYELGSCETKYSNLTSTKISNYDCMLFTTRELDEELVSHTRRRARLMILPRLPIVKVESNEPYILIKTQIRARCSFGVRDRLVILLRLKNRIRSRLRFFHTTEVHGYRIMSLIISR